MCTTFREKASGTECRPPRLGRGARLEVPSTSSLAATGLRDVWAGPVSARFRTPSRACRPQPIWALRPAGGHGVRPGDHTTYERHELAQDLNLRQPSFQLGALTTELAIGEWRA